MIYKLKELDELLKYHNNPLCERLVGVNNFINKLDEIDRLRKDLVVIIRGGCDLDIPSIFDKVEAYAAIATMQTPTVCAIGHTDEHKDFKNYCDHYEETPSFLGITLGDWVEKYKLS